MECPWNEGPGLPSPHSAFPGVAIPLMHVRWFLELQDNARQGTEEGKKGKRGPSALPPSKIFPSTMVTSYVLLSHSGDIELVAREAGK